MNHQQAYSIAHAVAISRENDSWREYAIGLIQLQSHRQFGTTDKKGKFTLSTRSEMINYIIEDANILYKAELNGGQYRRIMMLNQLANQKMKDIFSKGCK